MDINFRTMSTRQLIGFAGVFDQGGITLNVRDMHKLLQELHARAKETLIEDSEMHLGSIKLAKKECGSTVVAFNLKSFTNSVAA